MPIRFATPEDIPALVQLGKRMHAITRFRSFSYNEARVAACLRVALVEQKNRHACFVAEGAGGQLAGVLLAVLERHIFSDQLVASVMHYDVLPEKRMAGYGVKLLRAFEAWATRRGVAELFLGANSAADEGSPTQFVQRLGYSRVGENFAKLTTLR